MFLSLVYGDKLLDLDSYGAPLGDTLTLGDDNINVNMKMMMSAIPGVPGLDYPILSTDDLLTVAATTQFDCQGKEFGGKIEINFCQALGLGPGPTLISNLKLKKDQS